jgi:hypothetical protein
LLERMAVATSRVALGMPQGTAETVA